MTTGGPDRGRRIFLKAAAASAAVVVLVAAWWVLFGFARWGRWPEAPLPVPNGFDDIVRAAGLVPESPGPVTGPIDGLSTEGLRATVAGLREALAAVRTGIGRDCWVPPDDAFRVTPAKMQRIVGISAIARALEAEAAIAFREGRAGEAVRGCADLILLGAQVARGGVYLDFLVGSTLEIEGLAGIGRSREKLDGPAGREAIAGIAAAARRREPIEAVIGREKLFQDLNASFLDKLEAFIGRGNAWADDVAERRKRVEVFSALLAADLAARAHRADRGAWPPSLEALVPEYLGAVPVDPGSGKPLACRAVGDRFVLYGLGEDGKDDGGKPGSDVLLDDLLPEPEAPAGGAAGAAAGTEAK